MEAIYYVLFGALAAAAAFLELGRGKETGHGSMSREFLSFRNNYVLVYSLMMAGDWLQGPYVYALYEHYGFGRGDIGRLFIAGFGSSMVFGTIVGSLADKSGRKKAALLYVLTYTIGCFTKHWGLFMVLLVGRLFCGVATSLLYSAFESWLVAEHFKRGYEPEWLGGTFSKAVFFGNGLMAIVSGLLAQTLVGYFDLGRVAPFDAAAVVMVLGGLVVLATWSENYGDSSDRHGFTVQLQNAASAIRNDPKIALLGGMQALFEASMYTFVFLWTPALAPRGEDIPHGMIFSCFMVASMAGSALAGRLLTSQGCRVVTERYMQNVFMVAGATLFVPVLFHRSNDVKESLAAEGQGISWEGQLQLVAFCTFEFTVGIFWPSMMKMRSQYVPEEMRATIINFFRIPLNLFVCIVLYNTSVLPLSAMFGMCSIFLLLCAYLQRRLEILAREAKAIGPEDSNVHLLPTSSAK